MYSIGQLAKIARVSNRTLRYYEELGLIAPNSRGENRYRYYDDTHLQRLNTIKMLQESGFALKEIVAALQPQLDPQGNITYMGQEMAKKIFKALDQQRQKLIDRQKELHQAVEEVQRTMKSLTDCFGCKIASSLEECARCETGPGEVTHLGRQLGDLKRDYRMQQQNALNSGASESSQSKAINDKNSSRV